MQELSAAPLREPGGQTAHDPPEAGGEWVRLRLRAERLEWIPSLLAWLDRPFVIEYPDALRDHVHALARRLAAGADDVPGADGRTAEGGG